MKKVLLFIFAFGTLFARAQAPTNGYPPKIYANIQDNRHRDDSATNIPHKYALTQNTTDSTPQIFVWTTPSGDSLIFFVNGRYHIVSTSSSPGSVVANNGNSTGISAGLLSGRPSASNCLCYYFATNDSTLFYDNGSWIPIGGGGGGGSGITPSNTIKQYLNGFANFVTFTTDSIPEGTLNKYYTDARARGSIIFTTTGSGAATYNNSTGALNIPTPVIPVAANPTGTITGTANNGTATTWQRSDATQAIGTNAVTNALAAQAPTNTIKSNLTGGTANEADNTLANVATALGPFMPTTPVNVARNLSATTIGGNSTAVLGHVSGQPSTDSATEITLSDAQDFTFDSVKNHLKVMRINSAANNIASAIVHLTDSSLANASPAQMVTFISSGSGGGTANFLRADGTWAAPSGGGGLSAIPNRTVYTNISGASAVAIPARMPTWYLDQFTGVTADNIVDCTTGFQNALDTVSKYGGGILQLGAGIYKTTATVQIPNGKPIIIQGSGGPAFTSTPGFGLTKSYGGTVINNVNANDTAIWGLANGSGVRDLTVMDTVAGLTSANTAIAMDSGYTSFVQNVAIENFNIGLSVHGGQFFHADRVFTADIHKYNFFPQSYPGLDAGSFHFTECYSFQITAGASTHAIAFHAPNGGGLILDGCFWGGDSIGVDLTWQGFSDVFIHHCNYEFCSDRAININMPSGSSGLAHFIITDNEMWPGSGYHHGICIYDTVPGAPFARNIIIDHNIFDQSDTAILINGKIQYSEIGATNSFKYQVFTPIAVLNAPALSLSPVTIDFPQNVQQLAESGGHIHFDPNFGAYGQVTLTASDTLDIVNAGLNGFLSLNVTQGAGNYHLVCGANVYNNAQAHGTSIWLDPTNGHITTIQAIGNGYASGAITTAVNRYFPVNSMMYTDANNAINDIAAGTNGNVITMVSGVPAWAAPTGGMTNPMTTVGDVIIGGSAGAATRLGQGGNGTFLGVSGGTLGYFTPSGGGGSSPTGINGSMQYYWNGSQFGTPNVLYDTTNGGLHIEIPSTLTTQVNGKGLILKAITAATSGVPVQGAPSIVQESQIWNTSGTPASQPFRFSQYLTNTSGATINAQWNLGYQNNTTTNTQGLGFLPGTGLNINGTGAPGCVIDATQIGNSYGVLIRNSSVTLNLGVLNGTTGAIQFGAGTALNNANAANISTSGDWRFTGHVVAGTLTDPGTAQIYSLSGSLPQARLAFDATHFTSFTTNSGGGLLINPNGVTVTLVAPVASAATLNFPAGTKPTSMNDGDAAHTTGHFWIHDASLGDVDIFGGVSPTLQNVLTNGSTLTGNVTVSMATHNWTFSNGTVGVNTAATGTSSLSVAACSSGASSINLPAGTFPTSSTDGDIGNVSTTHHLDINLNGTVFHLDQPTKTITQSPGDNSTNIASTAYVDANRVIYSQTADATIANSTSSLTTLGTGVGSNVIAANTLVSGKAITIRGSGVISTAGSAPTVGFNFSNTSSFASIGSISGITGSMTNTPISWEFTGVVRGSGSGANIALFGWIDVNGTRTYTAFGSTYAFDTTIGQTFDEKIQFGTASASNTFTSNINLIRIQ